jgi:hypothetical protein
LSNEVKVMEEKLSKQYKELEELISIQRDCDVLMNRNGPVPILSQSAPSPTPHGQFSTSSPYSPIRARSSSPIPVNQANSFSSPSSQIPSRKYDDTQRGQHREQQQREQQQQQQQQQQQAHHVQERSNETVNGGYKTSHDAFREVVIRRIDQLESSLHSNFNEISRTNKAIDSLTARINDNEEQCEGYLTEKSPYMFEIQVRFEELEKKLGGAEELSEIVTTMGMLIKICKLL